jgi:RNA polymerase sigma factor (sigma-70 family)
MIPPCPFRDGADGDPDDVALLGRIRQGSRDALEALVVRHQAWIYNLVLRMVYLPQDAEDATQEVLVKMVTKLSAFEGRSHFRTWLYRIAVNHVLNMRRTPAEAAGWTFERYGQALASAPDLDLPDPRTVPADLQLLVDEARIGCTTGMLLCLDREQRLVYVLGGIFGVSARVGAELLEVSPENFRQKLARARRDLHQFMQRHCGLVNAANPCRCARKTQAFIQAGYVDPHHLLFAKAHLARVREAAPSLQEEMEGLDAAYAAIHREHPFQPSPDFVAALRELMNQPAFRSILGPRHP